MTEILTEEKKPIIGVFRKIGDEIICYGGFNSEKDALNYKTRLEERYGFVNEKFDSGVFFIDSVIPDTPYFFWDRLTRHFDTTGETFLPQVRKD